MISSKFTGEADEANAIAKAMAGGTSNPLTPDPLTSNPPNPINIPPAQMLPTEPGGVGSTFTGADGLTYEVVEEVIATGEDYVDPQNTTSEEDE